MDKPTIGFVGLGQMGYPMASRLVAAGFRLVVADADAVRADQFVTQTGATLAPSAGLWSGVDVLITMLPTSNIVESVLLQNGLAQRLPKGTLVVDMGSSEPLRSRALAETLVDLGLQFLDAPVSGGVKGAVNGTLAIMVGGEAHGLERARSVLGHLGKNIFHVGSAGAGHAAKALNNYVSAATLLATSEALHAAERFGIDPAMLTDVLNASSGRSNTSENKVKQFMLSGSFDSGFGLRLMAKDVRIAMNLAEGLGQATPLGNVCVTVWEEAARGSENTTDHTELYRLLESSTAISSPVSDQESQASKEER